MLIKKCTALLILVTFVLNSTVLAIDQLRVDCEAIRAKIKLEALPVKKKMYNILALDGGGIRGLIPGQIISQVETIAYNYAKEKKVTDNANFKKCFAYEG